MAAAISQKQAAAWQMNRHEPVYERGTVRLAEYRKTFPDDARVMVRDKGTHELVPFTLRSGRPLFIRECLPERADLCLDADGVLLEQHEFRERYIVFLSSYLTPPNFDVSAEPIPNVAAYLNRKPDEWSESSGMVEIDYDPNFGDEFKPRVMFDGNREIPVEEYERQQAEKQAKEDRMERLLMAIGEKVLVEGDAAPIPEPEGVSVEDVSAHTAPTGKEQAPCGDYITEGYLKQHQRFCKHESCGGAPEAA